MAYANPEDIQDERKRADGYGIARFNKSQLTITFECWPRFCDVKKGDLQQFPGWPITVAMDANDGRKITGWLPELMFEGAVDPVVQVIEQTSGEILYTIRIKGDRFQGRVYSSEPHTMKIGRDRSDSVTISDLTPKEKTVAGQRKVRIV